MFFQFSFEIRGQNYFPDNHWGEGGGGGQGKSLRIMADKGFTLQKECDARSVHLRIPAGKRGAIQMSSRDLVQTKQIANIRILVEQIKHLKMAFTNVT